MYTKYETYAKRVLIFNFE